MAVLVSHCANHGMIPAIFGGSGQIAVALFFILSGFLMAFLYGHRPRGYVGTYLTHRFARVIPLYLLIVALSILFPLALFPINTPQVALAHFGFVYGAWTLWTIPVEVQFYALFVAIWLAPKKAIPALFVAQPIVAGILFFVGFPLNTLPFWLHFFLFGTVCGFVWHKHGEAITARAKPYSAWGWLILAFAIVAIPGVRHALHIPVLPPPIDPIAITAMCGLFVGSLVGLAPLKRMFSSTALRYLGGISYGVYLIHYPVVLWAATLPVPGVVQFAIVAGGSIGLADLSYRFFETPMREWIMRQPSREKRRQVAADNFAIMRQLNGNRF